MPNDRFFHKSAGHSEKVNTLTDFEELIWRYYILSADDFGVMRFDHRAIQNDHERAGSRPAKMVQRALDRIVDATLVYLFEHQGRSYCYSRNWQDYQKVDYPRDTIAPSPPAEELARCTADTVELFGYHPGGKKGRAIRKLVSEGLSIESARIQLLSDDSFDEYLRFTRAGALAKAKAQANGQGSGSDDTSAVQRLVQRHAELYQQFCGVGYIGNAHKDYEASRLIVKTFPDLSMQDAILTYGLNDPDPFMAKGTRTIPKIASQASKYAEELKAKNLA